METLKLVKTIHHICTSQYLSIAPNVKTRGGFTQQTNLYFNIKCIKKVRKRLILTKTINIFINY